MFEYVYYISFEFGCYQSQSDNSWLGFGLSDNGLQKESSYRNLMYIIFLYNLGEENGGPLEKSFSIVGPASLQKESSYRPVEHHVLI